MTILLLLSALATGLLAGLLAGLFGVGGGIVIVPILLFLFHQDGINPVFSMQLAVGTSLSSIVFTNTFSALGHQRHGAVRWSLVREYVPGILLGGWFGSHLAALMDGEQLRILFGVFEILVGLKMSAFYPATRPPLTFTMPTQLPPFIAVVIGMISTLFGIGGGTLSVPVLTLLHHTSMREAVGTSSAIGIVIALAGSVGFIHAGWEFPGLPPDAIGFVLPSVFFALSIGALFTSNLGVWMAHNIDQEKLKRFFGLFLILVGGKLVWM